MTVRSYCQPALTLIRTTFDSRNVAGTVTKYAVVSRAIKS